MPELPEVEAYKNCISRYCLHKTIERSAKKILVGKKFSSVERIGKYLIITISGTTKKLIMHFGLTGFLFYAKKEPEKKVRSSRMNIIFTNGSALYFIDLRKFGKIWFTENLDKILKKLGTDATKISRNSFLSLMKENESKNIKAFLMDQAVIAGIGNEYSDELLFQAGISPRHKIKELSTKEWGRIYTKMKAVLAYATRVRKKQIQQTPDQLFFSKEGGAVFKSSYMQAHRHTDKRCPKDKSHKLKKVTVGGRSSYYCAQDQK